MVDSSEPPAPVLPTERAIDRLDAELVLAKVSAELFSRESPAARVGRFVLIDKVGAGAMGSVFSAYDPQLDRKVAIKVLHDNPARTNGRLLLREARALARLSHRNVATVYEVGTLGDQQGADVFLAMEFIDGLSLDRWIDEPRSVAEIVRVFVQVADGLAAAHATSMVHRDVKPSNVMVSNHGGPVVVLDFGLARVPASYETPTGQGTADGSTITAKGVVGTPAYMAPEQYCGEPVTQLSDQFSYCVALYEALNGARPWAGPPAIDHERRPAPSRKEVPGWLHAAIMRGLAADPEQRWPSMEALATELRRRSRGSRRGLAAAVLGTGVAVVAGWMGSGLANETCDAAREVEQVWGAETRTAVTEALRDMQPEARGEPVTQRLDGYADALRLAHEAACADERANTSAKTREIHTCLQGQTARLAEAITLLRSPDADVLAHAHRLVPTADALRACHGPAPTTPVADPDLRRQLEREIARATVLSEAGRADEGLEVAGHARQRATEGQAPGLAARAGVSMARALAYSGQYSEAATILRDVLVEAERADDQLARMDALRVLGSTLVELSAFDEAEHVIAIADAALSRFPQRPVAWDSGLAATRGDIAHGRGDYERALEYYRRHETLASSPGLSPSARISARSRIVTALVRLRRYDEALELQASIRHDLLTLHGPDHVGLAVGDSIRGAIHFSRREYQAAEAALRSALQLRDRIYGTDHPNSSAVLNNLGAVLAVSDPVAAVPVLERAVRTTAASHGPRTIQAAKAHHNLGDAHRGVDQLDRAHKSYLQAFELHDELGGAASTQRLLSELRLAEV
nr:protein kinase [Deltaproteobacteria bacterium]